MLQVSLLKQNPEWVKQRLAVKHFAPLTLVDDIIALDDKRKKIQFDFDNAQSQVNALSKNIGKLMAAGQKEEAEQIKKQVADFKTDTASFNETLKQVEDNLQALLVQLPNLPKDIVPAGKTPQDNIEVKKEGVVPVLENGVPHWDLIKKYDIIDFEKGAKITGSGFPVYKGQGAKLQRALVQFFLDFNTEAGYTEYLPPLMVNEQSAYSTGQLPDKEGQMYHIQADNFYMIPTAEVPITNIYRDEILPLASLPIKMTAYTPCFRREAGSFGKDVRGLNRLHQFDKVELVQITEPTKSMEALDEMVTHVEKLLQALNLPYRLLRLCGGDMSFTSAITYDFEVFSAAQQMWLEVSSVSNFDTYQANRAKIRYKDEHGKNQLVHTLNGSALALPRITAALLENNQTSDGIMLPKALHTYFGKELIK